MIVSGGMLDYLIEEGNKGMTGPLYRRRFPCRLHALWTVSRQCLTQALNAILGFHKLNFQPAIHSRHGTMLKVGSQKLSIVLLVLPAAHNVSVPAACDGTHT